MLLNSLLLWSKTNAWLSAPGTVVPGGLASFNSRLFDRLWNNCRCSGMSDCSKHSGGLDCVCLNSVGGVSGDLLSWSSLPASEWVPIPSSALSKSCLTLSLTSGRLSKEGLGFVVVSTSETEMWVSQVSLIVWRVLRPSFELRPALPIVNGARRLSMHSCWAKEFSRCCKIK